MKIYKPLRYATVCTIIIIASSMLVWSQQFGLMSKKTSKKVKSTTSISDEKLREFSNNLNKHLNGDKSKQNNQMQATRDSRIFQFKSAPAFNILQNGIMNESGNPSTIYRNPNGTIKYLSDFQSSPLYNSKKSNNILLAVNAQIYLDKNRELLKIKNPAEEFVINSEKVDGEGNKHLKFYQHYKGIQVWGKEIVLHYNTQNVLYHLNADYIPTPEGINTTAELSSRQALIKVKDNLEKTIRIHELPDNLKKMLDYTGPTSEKVIWTEEQSGKLYLAWMVDIRPNIIDNWKYFIDAVTGEILLKYNTSPSDGPQKANAADLKGTSRQINTYQYSGNYYMWDASRPMLKGTMPNAQGLIVTYTNNNGDVNSAWNPKPVTSANNSWTDAASVSSHYNVGLIYEYYKNTFNRNSINNEGMDMITVLHVKQDGAAIDNAWWNGKFVTLGDGAQITTSWAGALDFIAHEFTHGVVTFTVDLEYLNQSGALNEAFADWGGAMVDRDDWTLGEDNAKKSYFTTGCVRDMANPHNGGTKGDGIWIPAHMNEFMNMSTDRDNGGVHYNCGIINKATYLLGTAITREKLEQIYYKVLNNNYLTKQAKFIDMRLACVKAAGELYGTNSSEVNAVKKAFDDVGITDGNGSSPNPDKSPINGDEWIACVQAADLNLYKVRSVIVNQNDDIVQLSQTAMSTNSGSVISVPDGGAFILFIDENNYVKYIKSDGTNEGYLSSTGDWEAISISPDGKYLAAISTLEEPIIYFFDLEKNTYQTIDLYNPNTNQTDDYTEPLYPNSMCWNITGTLLMYDAMNYSMKLNGDESFYWDMNIISVKDGVIVSAFPPLETGINIGNPTFAKNNEYVFMFDLFDENTGNGEILAGNLFSGETGTIVTYDASSVSAGNPTYSAFDTYAAFQVYNKSDQTYYIYKIPLDAKKLNSTGQSSGIVSNAGLPKWFSIGTRPVKVEENTVSSNNLISIVPNPASGACWINMDSQSGGKFASIIISDLTGMVLFSTRFDSFEKEYYWDCSDNFGNPLGNGMYYIRINYYDNSMKLTSEVKPLLLVR